MARSASDLLTARALAAQYRDMARSIDQEKADPKFRSMPLTRRILGQYAAIARKAAIGEEMDPEPKYVVCGICGGTNVCLAVR
jgi:hypothetical protein